MTQGWRAVLLAGGRSSRMGTNKALLPWGDGTLLTHMHDVLRAAGADRVIVSGDRPGIDGVPDVLPDTGPMGALAQLAPRLEDGTWLTVPVDMPLLSQDLIDALLATSSACACVQDHMLPMVLRIDDGMRAVMADIGSRSGRERSLRALQQSLHVQHLPVAPWQRALRNCNTPEDWAVLQQLA
ncbi:MAG: molybdenum cofactor guanylyltransferase [Xanthomonas sp.]|nr:molybdenum cofactor guanylyltransferase [Xanthomonas sp.]